LDLDYPPDNKAQHPFPTRRSSDLLHVTFEETTQAAWLHDVIRHFVTEVVVCDPRRNKLLAEGSKTDKVDARKLADLLRTGMLRSDRKSTRLNSSHQIISYAVFCLT